MYSFKEDDIFILFFYIKEKIKNKVVFSIDIQKNHYIICIDKMEGQNMVINIIKLILGLILILWLVYIINSTKIEVPCILTDINVHCNTNMGGNNAM